MMLFRLDTVILSLMATLAAVGRYGAAYRLLEASLFITYALMGAFVPMYTYLDEDSEPTVGGAFVVTTGAVDQVAQALHGSSPRPGQPRARPRRAPRRAGRAARS